MKPKVTINKITISDGSIERAPVVRQDRIDCDPDRHTIKFSDGLSCKVLNFSPFGLAIESNRPLNDQYSEAVFCVDNFPVSQISLKKVRETSTLSECICTAFSVEGKPLDIEAAFSMKQLNEILNGATESLSMDAKLRDGFKLIVLEVKNVLLRLQNEINSLNQNSFNTDLRTLVHCENIIALRVSDYLSGCMDPYYNKIIDTLKDINQNDLTAHFDYFRKNVGQIMYQAAYAHRAYTKPKGYAGDFEMMNHVYYRELRGDTLFGKCLQRYFVDEPAAVAVRNREKYLRTKINQIVQKSDQDNGIKILSVACGPAMEIQNLIRDPNFKTENIEFVLLDQDLDALKHAQRRIIEVSREEKKPILLKLLNINIKQVIQNGLPENDFNLVYSAGLFDYFTDPVAKYAAAQLFAGLKKGGVLIIGNFSLKNPNQFAMGLIMDWNLIYRSEKKMEELFEGLGSYSLEQEDQGINLFANLKK